MNNTATRSPLSLRFGAPGIIPDTATASWGARMISRGLEPIDMVHDRQDCAGADLNHLLERLNSGLLQQIKVTIDELRYEALMRNDVAEDFVLYDEDGIVVVANTSGSYGYCYVTAFYTPEEK